MSSGLNTLPSAPVWRQFSFFNVAPVKDAHDLASSPSIFKTPAEVSAIASSSAGVFVADIRGNVNLLNRSFEPAKTWSAHVGGRVTHMVEQQGILITLGEEDASRLPLLKVWDLEHFEKDTGLPSLLRSVKVQHGSRPHPVTTVALSASLSHLAVGLGDGTVLLYRHLDQSLFSGSNALNALPKPKVIQEYPTEPITGLGFREPKPTAEDKADRENLHLFIVTTNRVLCYLAAGKGSGATPTVVDEVGCGLGCAAMDGRAREMVVARDEAIYMCAPDGRGACYAVEWPKITVTPYKNYLVIVSPPFFPSGTSASATVRNYVARAPNPASVLQTDVSKVTIFDLENKFIAYSESAFKEGIREVICQWGQIFILSNDGKLFRLDEKPTTDKLDILFRKANYTLAVGVARSQGVEESGIADIYRQYGDHLYTKGDFDGAMQQFIKTLGHLQPSYVIRKFLDAQRIHNLTTYLQELHSRGLANSDHTTLLLNTYTKLKDVARLDSFIKTESHKANGTGDSKDGLPFDLETAIRVCRQAGYFDHAAYLAKKYDRHEDYLRIQIEDTKNFKAALEFLRKLGPEAAEKNLARYGRLMLTSLPDETTQLLIDLCSGLLGAEPPDSAEVASPTKAAQSGPSYLSYLNYNRAANLFTGDFNEPSPTAAKTGAPDPSARNIAKRQSVVDSEASRTASPAPQMLTSRPMYKRPSPKQYFPHYIDHAEHFLVFLEAVAVNRWGQKVEGNQKPVVPSSPDVGQDVESDKVDQTAVWNTLLELYLSLSEKKVETGSKGALATPAGYRDKALRLLQQATLPYDPTHALIVCSTRSFTDGLILLWEKMGMYDDVLRFWMDKDKEGDSGASARVLEHLRQYGPKQPHLYPLVLRFLTSTPALLSRHTTDVESILEHIEQEKIMPPLGVVQVLSRNGVASVGLVKKWLMTRIAESKEEIEADQRLIESYRAETKTKLQEIAELSDPEHPRVFHVTRCSRCGEQLYLPSVHFMCKHSYHQKCLPDHETECPNCARAHGLIREIQKDNELYASNHDQFRQDVDADGFAAVASAFSKGLLAYGKVEELPA